MKIKIDENKFREAGLGFARSGNQAMFSVPGIAGFVRAAIVDDEIDFVPERSAGQKQVLAALKIVA